MAALLPHGEVERWAPSSDQVLAARKHEANPDKAYYDERLPSSRGSDMEEDLGDFSADGESDLGSRRVAGIEEALAQPQRER